MNFIIIFLINKEGRTTLEGRIIFLIHEGRTTLEGRTSPKGQTIPKGWTTPEGRTIAHQHAHRLSYFTLLGRPDFTRKMNHTRRANHFPSSRPLAISFYPSPGCQDLTVRSNHAWRMNHTRRPNHASYNKEHTYATLHAILRPNPCNLARSNPNNDGSWKKSRYTHI